jgi:hypothetical protein
MSVVNQPIQTLLQQRRELRDCLLELKQEISALKDRSDKIIVPDDRVEQPPAVNSNVKTEQGSFSEPMALAQGLVEPTAPPEPSQVQVWSNPAPAPSASVPASISPLPTPPSYDDLADLGTPAAIIPPVQSNPETGSETQIEGRPDVLTDTVTKAPSDKAEITTEDNRNVGKLLEEAILLARFFLHHPSSAHNSSLNKLDEAIKQVRSLPPSAKRDLAYQELKNSYRAVVAVVQPETGVSGKTISESEGSVPILWGLPLMISSLILVWLPLMIVLRGVVPQMFVSGFAYEVSTGFTILAVFLWGVTGALSCQAFKIAARVHKRRYDKRQFRDTALQAVVGGVLAISVMPLVFLLTDFTGIERDVALSVGAFGVGSVTGILFGVFHKALPKDPTKKH